MNLDLDDDFPFYGGSEQLTKLFKENSLPDISFKFSAPKHPPRGTKPFQNNVPLKVVCGSTVGAFQLKVDGYKSEGKLGLAIIGNDEHGYYQLYMYESDERKVTSAEISLHFAFLVQEHNYATFKDNHKIQWSVHFDRYSDLIDFSKEVALARWRSSQGCQTKLVQAAFKGKTDQVVKKNDSIRVLYNIFLLSSENIVHEGAVGKAVTAPASAPSWETNLIGACVKSRRFVIIPSHLCNSLDTSVPNGFHLMLDMEIVETVPPPTSNIEQPSQTPVTSNPPQTSLEKKGDGDNLSGRMARIGYALPSLQVPENESSISLPDKTKSVPNEVLTSVSTSSSLSTHSRGDLPSTNELSDITTSPQFNVLFSEVRTNNSEIRMNLNRVTDKIDSLTNKMDFLPVFNQKMLPALEKFQNVDSLICKLVEQSNAIMSTLERNTPGQLESVLNEVMQLKKRNAELESFLEVSGSTCQILKDKIVELNKKLSETEHLGSVAQNLSCSLGQGNCERKIKNLESSLKNLQERNYALLEATEHLERQNRELSEQASLIQETKLRSQLGEKELKIVQLERELNKLNLRINKNNDKEMKEIEITDAIKGVINKSYKMLKEGLKDLVKDGSQLDPLLARILKEAASEYLESRKHHTLFRVEEESECADEVDRRAEGSEQGNHPLSPSDIRLPLPVPRPRKPPPASQPLVLKPPQPTPAISKPSLPPISDDVKEEISSLSNESKSSLAVENASASNSSPPQNLKEIPKQGSKFEASNKNISIPSSEDVPPLSVPNNDKNLEEASGSTNIENNSEIKKADSSTKSNDIYSSSYYAPFIPTTPPPLTDDFSDESQES